MGGRHIPGEAENFGHVAKFLGRVVKGGKIFGRVAKGGGEKFWTRRRGGSKQFWILNFLESLGKIKGHV